MKPRPNQGRRKRRDRHDFEMLDWYADTEDGNREFLRKLINVYSNERKKRGQG